MSDITARATKRPLTLALPAEVLVDAVIHLIGIAASIGLVVVMMPKLAELPPDRSMAMWVYFITLVVLWIASMAFNVCPVSRLKAHLARLDQAAIFLFIAGTYTPFLAIIRDTDIGELAALFVWGAALLGMAGKLLIPHRFGRVAIPVYAALGWASLLLVPTMAEIVPLSAVWFLAAGGVAYTVGIAFHVNEKLPFHLAIWHMFVALGAGLHCVAVCQSLGV